MEAIHGNSFTMNTTESEIHLRFRTVTPVFDQNGNRIGDEVVKETIVIMTPDAYNGFRRMIDMAERSATKDQ